MICKVCGNEIVETILDTYINIYAEDGYCSKKCCIFSRKVKNFYDSLSFDQKLEFWCLWDNGIFTDKIWESYLDKTIEDPRDLED